MNLIEPTDVQSSRRRLGQAIGRRCCRQLHARPASPPWPRAQVRTAQLAHQDRLRCCRRAIVSGWISGRFRGRNQPAAARKFDLPLFRFPLRGQTGAGGFPPRRQARPAPANCAGPTRASGSPHKRAAPPCESPAGFPVPRSLIRLRPEPFLRLDAQTREIVLAKHSRLG